MLLNLSLTSKKMWLVMTRRSADNKERNREGGREGRREEREKGGRNEQKKRELQESQVNRS